MFFLVFRGVYEVVLRDANIHLTCLQWMAFSQKCLYSCTHKLTYTAGVLTFLAFCVTSDFTSESHAFLLERVNRKVPITFDSQEITPVQRCWLIMDIDKKHCVMKDN